MKSKKETVEPVTDTTDTDDVLYIKPKLSSKEPKRVNVKRIIEAFDKCFGLTTEAAKAIGISFEQLKREIKLNPRLQKELDRVEEANLDFAESKLRKLIDKENIPAVLFYLKCKGKKRGYVEHANDVAIQTKPILFKYTPATKADIQKANEALQTVEE